MSLITTVQSTANKLRNALLQAIVLMLLLWLSFEIVFAFYEALGGCSTFQPSSLSATSPAGGNQSIPLCLSDLAASVVAMALGIWAYVRGLRQWHRMRSGNRKVSDPEREYRELP